MSSATDELRRLLDERGVEWRDSSDDSVLHTTWNNMSCWFNEFGDGWTAWGMAMQGTPAQTIEATLGRGELERENAKLRERIDAAHMSRLLTENENESLRELVRDLWRFTGAACKKYPRLFDPPAQGGQAVRNNMLVDFEIRLRELGVEVEG